MRVRELEEREKKESKKLADEDALRKIRVAEETIEHLQKKLAATKQVSVWIFFYVANIMEHLYRVMPQTRALQYVQGALLFSASEVAADMVMMPNRCL